jgi:DNA-directed RNA polymerase specialized sigma24 family protein
MTACTAVPNPEQHTGEGEAEETHMHERPLRGDPDGNGPVVDDFGQRLLDHVEMLYRVAVNLTREPRGAEYLTRSVLCQAWICREKLDGNPRLKAELLKWLRRAFLDHAKVLGLGDLMAASGASLRKKARQDKAGLDRQESRTASAHLSVAT